MKKILIGFLAVLVLAVATALVAPSFIDWNAYRAEIAAEIRKATGRTLSIDGDIDVALLPAPKLTLARARLSNLAGAADPDMVRLAGLDLRVAFWSLLSGKVVVRSVVLRGADIRLEKLADGRVNWQFKEPRRTAPGPGGGLDQGGGRLGDSISLEQVIIESGSLSFRDSQKGTVQRVVGINARIAAATLSGPFAARGEFRIGGVPIGFELQSGRIESGASTKLTVEARFLGAKAKLRYSGMVTAGAPGPTVTGKLSAQGPDLGALIEALGRAAGGGGAGPSKRAGALAQPFTLTAGITGGTDTLSLNDIAAEVGGTRLSGAITIAPGTVTNIDGTFKINRLDLDRWLEAGHVRFAYVIGTTWIQAMAGSTALDETFNRLVKLNPNQVRSCDKQTIIDTLKKRVDSGGPMVVNQEIYLRNPIGSKYADIGLPAATWGEEDFTRANSERRVRLYSKFYDPPGDAKPDWQIVAMLAKKMGFEGYDWKDSNDVFEESCRFSRGSRKDYNAIRIMARRKGMRAHDFLRQYGTTGLQAPLLLDGDRIIETKRLHDYNRTDLPDTGPEKATIFNSRLVAFKTHTGKLNLVKSPWSI